MHNKTKVRSYTDKQLLDKVKSLDTFKGLPAGYWILGIRSNEDVFDTFDDKFYLYYNNVFVFIL